MSSRPVLRKRANRVRKLMRRKLPAHIDLVQWLQDRRYADTAGQARKLLEEGCVKTQGGNVLGRRAINVRSDDKDVVQYQADPLVPAELRPEIVFIKPAR